jgi:hypothetical protein
MLVFQLPQLLVDLFVQPGFFKDLLQVGLPVGQPRLGQQRLAFARSNGEIPGSREHRLAGLGAALAGEQGFSPAVRFTNFAFKEVKLGFEQLDRFFCTFVLGGIFGQGPLLGQFAGQRPAGQTVYKSIFSGSHSSSLLTAVCPHFWHCHRSVYSLV